MGVEEVVPEDVAPQRELSEPEVTGTQWRPMALAALGVVLFVDGIRRRSVRGSLMAILGSVLLFRAAGTSNSGPIESGTQQPTVFRDSITVGRSPEDLSEFVREPANLGEALRPFADVRSAGPDRLRFTVDPPVGPDVHWRMALVEERPGEVLRWTNERRRIVPYEMVVHFRPAPGGRGTELTLELKFDPPGGRHGATVLQRLDVVPESLVGVVLDRLKSLAETGEIPTSAVDSSGRGGFR